jgi:hypothetical protein
MYSRLSLYKYNRFSRNLLYDDENGRMGEIKVVGGIDNNQNMRANIDIIILISEITVR